jgi:hypothetical protein
MKTGSAGRGHADDFDTWACNPPREAERRFDESHRSAGKPIRTRTPYSESIAYSAKNLSRVKYYKPKQQLHAQKNIVGRQTGRCSDKEADDEKVDTQLSSSCEQ